MRRSKARGISQKEAYDKGVVLPNEYFWIDGPNGRHLYLVLPVLGITLEAWYEWNQMSHGAIKSICRQLARSMQFLHGQGICHGDFRPSNILMKVKDPNHFSKDQIIDMFGGQYADAVQTYSGEDPGPCAPEYVVVPGDWDKFRVVGLVTEDIAIVDFGEAYDPSDPPSFMGIPTGFAAPEVVFKGKPSFGTDIWALICTFLSLEFIPFFGGNVWQVTSDLELHIGPLPEKYRPTFQQKWYQYQLSKYKHIRIKDPSEPPPEKVPLPEPSSPLEPITWTSEAIANKTKKEAERTGFSDIFAADIGREWTRSSRPLDGGFSHKTYALPRQDVLQLADLARKAFKYDIEERITISEILDHPWLYQSKLAGVNVSPAPLRRLFASCWQRSTQAHRSYIASAWTFVSYLLQVVFWLKLLELFFWCLLWCWCKATKSCLNPEDRSF